MASTSESVSDEININHYASDSYFDEKGLQYLKNDYYRAMEETITKLKTEEYSEQFIWNRDFVNQCILHLKQGENNAISNITDFVDFKLKYNLDDYEIITRDGRDCLVKKGEIGDVIEHKVVIPHEDSFNLVWQTHKQTDHSDETKLFESLALKCVINKFVAKVMKDVCYVCKVEGKPNVRCGAYLTRPLRIHDVYGLNVILVYKDLATKFIQLRPISTEAQNLDIALELFKLFTDFGPPVNLEVTDTVFFPAIDYLKMLLPGVDVKLRVVEMDKRKVSFIEDKIAKWIDENGDNWAIGCHIVQWEINNEKAGC